jgi:uncharacterized membrane protein YjjP (DUF1212 family)
MKKLREKMFDALIACTIGFLIALMSSFIDILKSLQSVPVDQVAGAVTTAAVYMMKSFNRYT